MRDIADPFYRKVSNYYDRDAGMNFEALNTMADLHASAASIHELLAPEGCAVLTFVNKWYLQEMLVQALLLNFKVKKRFPTPGLESLLN
ncbi:MAG: hypothetical protein R6W71_06420 [Bacteroidales bacterium]